MILFVWIVVSEWGIRVKLKLVEIMLIVEIICGDCCFNLGWNFVW